MTTYAPLFITLDFDENSGKAGLRPIQMFEIVKRACGIQLPQNKPTKSLYFSFQELRSAQYIISRPIVFFPECTKTNGKGVLDMPKRAVRMIKDAALKD